MRKIYILIATALLFSINTKAQTVSKLYGTAGYHGTIIGNVATLPSNNAALYGPANIVIDKNTRAWIVESLGNRLRMLEYINTPTTVYNRAGSPQSLSGSSDGTGVNASFSSPAGVVVDSIGNIYVSDAGNNCIRKVAAYINAGTSQLVSTFAGTKGFTGGFADGIGAAAQFNNPGDLAIDSLQNIYVADTWNNCIRKITPSGNVTTVAGSTTQGSIDGTGAAARFTNPMGLGWLNKTELLIADYGLPYTGNAKIRKLNVFTGVVTTIAGTGALGTSDGDALTQCSFSAPKDIAVDSNKTIYVVEGDSINTIRKITGNCVTTFAGTANTNGSTDGIGSVARFNNPTGIIYNAGYLYVTDYGNEIIRKVTIPGTPAGSTPVATFGSTTTTAGNTTQIFTFHDSTTGPVNSRVWQFSPHNQLYKNGTDSTSQDVQVQFQIKTSYTITLQVINCWGTSTKVRTNYIVITNTGIHEVDANEQVSIFPNPSKGIFDVSLNGTEDDQAVIRIMDIHGKTILEQKALRNVETIDLSNVKNGIYILNVSGKQTSVTKKIVIE